MIGLIQNTLQPKYVLICFLFCASQVFAISNKLNDGTSIWNELEVSSDTNSFGKRTFQDNVQEDYVLNRDSIQYFKQKSFEYADQGDSAEAIAYFKKYVSATGDLSILNDHIYDNIKNSKEYQEIKENYSPRLTFLSIFYLYAGFLGFYIFIMLLIKRKVDRISTMLMGLFVLFHSIFILHLSLYIIKYQFYVPETLFISTTFSFLYGPLLYFYFKRVMCQYTFRWIDLLHLTPSIILFIYIMPYYAMSSLEKFNVLFDQGTFLLPGATTIIIVKIASLSIYAFLIVRMYLNNTPSSKKQKNVYIWQRNIIAIFVVYIVAYIIYAGIITDVINYPDKHAFPITNGSVPQSSL